MELVTNTSNIFVNNILDIPKLERGKILVYVAGKYSDDTPEKIDSNIAKARETAITLWNEGFVTYCPHLNTSHFPGEYWDVVVPQLHILSKCNAIFMMDNWKNSLGATIEYAFALYFNIPVYFQSN